METRVLIRSSRKPNTINLPPQWCSWWNLIWLASWSQRYSCFKVWTQGLTDRRTNGRTRACVPYYKITLNLRLWWAKNKIRLSVRTVFGTHHLRSDHVNTGVNFQFVTNWYSLFNYRAHFESQLSWKVNFHSFKKWIQFLECSWNLFGSLAK